MVRPGFRLAVAGLPLLLVLLAGCNSSGNSPYGYGQGGAIDLASLAASFHNQPAANRKVENDQLPLSFIDSQGKPVDLGKFRDKSNVVLTVVKGMPQSSGGKFCPGCLAQMNSFAANVDGFRQRSAEVLVVFPGKADMLGDFLTQAKAFPADGKASGPAACPVPLLLDKDMAACRQLDILGDWAKPSTYIIDKKGNVVYAYVGEGTTDRPSLKALFGELDKLNAKK